MPKPSSRRGRRSAHDSHCAGSPRREDNSPLPFAPEHDRKLAQLCNQAHERLDLVLAGELHDPILDGLWVVEVQPEPGGAGLIVTLAAPDPSPDRLLDPHGLAAIQAAVDAIKGRLRSEVAAAITRKRTPHLRFVVIPERALRPPSDRSDTPYREGEIAEPASAADAQPNAPKSAIEHPDPLGALSCATAAGALALGPDSPPYHAWLAHRLTPEVEAALARLRAREDVAALAVMPDVHLAAEVCVGVALATHTTLIPAAVGSDIGCGMVALGFDVEADAAVACGPRILAALTARIPILRHPGRRCPPLPDALAEAPLSAPPLERAKHHEARLQLGSLGRGNHFVELQRDDEGRLWAMIHSGSRGIGQRIRDWHEARAHAPGLGPPGIPADSPAGGAYLADLDWALAYADHNRARLRAAVTEILDEALGARPLPETEIRCHHNFVRRELHMIAGAAAWVWVHRKGAIAAGVDEPGIIPGSMGSDSFLVAGRGEPRSLCSSSHGAGRALARGAAFRAIPSKLLRQQLRGVWFDERLADRLRDEAPSAYTPIGEVMRAQRALTRIVRRLRPVLAFKGG